jgi:lipopolysaccharide biosynthesis regulator YciM
MGAAVAVVIIVVIVVALSVVGARRRRTTAGVAEESSYQLGINSLITGDRPAAVRHLTKAVREDPSNVDAYSKLGDLLRERGQLKQATQIHRELLVRRKLSSPNRREVTKSLARDLVAAKRWKEALEFLSSLPRADRSDVQVLSMVRDAHEALGDLDKAAQAHKEILKTDASSSQPRPGVYRAHLGLAALRRGDRKKAKAEFQAAIKEKPIPYLAYLYLGDIAVQENDTERAVAYWMRIVIDKPECAHFVFDRLEKAYYEMGDFGRMMGLYEEVLSKNPANVAALVGLSKMMERKGDIDGAVRSASEAVKLGGDSIEPRRQLMSLLMRNRRFEEAAEAGQALIEQLSGGKGARACPSCGAQQEERAWRCDVCRAWIDEC